MKKKLMAVLTACMVLCMGTTVFAANSTTTKVTSKTTGVTAAATTSANVDSAKKAATAKGYELVDTFELTADTASMTKEGDGNYKVVLSAPSIKSTDSVKVFHFVNNEWKELSATAGDGTVTFETDSFSPFAIVKTAASTASSPKTGATAPIVAMVAIMAAAGAVYCTKKSRA